jgi:hypothetical protein
MFIVGLVESELRGQVPRITYFQDRIRKKSQGRFVKKNFAVCKSFSEISGICIHEQTSGLQRTRKEQDGCLEVDARNDKTST